MDMIATTFDIAMFLSRGGDCVQGIARGIARVIIENFFYVGRPRMKVALEDDEERFEFNRRTTSGLEQLDAPTVAAWFEPGATKARATTRSTRTHHATTGASELDAIFPNLQTGWTG